MVYSVHLVTFSILERIDVGETAWRHGVPLAGAPFSILERIDVGETTAALPRCRRLPLSVSSNGSTWVKLGRCGGQYRRDASFQYPRTDRRG